MTGLRPKRIGIGLGLKNLVLFTSLPIRPQCRTSCSRSNDNLLPSHKTQ